MYTVKGRYPDEDVAEIEKARKLLLNMSKRHKLKLGNIHRAMNSIIDEVVEHMILNMRKEGYTIRKIARMIHMDDKRVSAILKGPAKLIKPAKRAKVACSHKCCKSGKSGKSGK